MDDQLPGEEPPMAKKDLPTLREELTFACREAVKRMKVSPAARREILWEAWEIMRMGQLKYDMFQIKCAELILRALVEASGDWRQIDDGLTTALAALRTADQPSGGNLIVKS